MSTQPHDASDSAVDAVPSTLGSEDCPRCHDPDNNEYHPLKPGLYDLGDICAVYETPNTPVHHAMRRTPPSPPRPLPTGTLATRGRERGPRPAVMLSPKTRRQTMCFLCLLGTFNGETDITKLARILQFFTLPVYPHHMLSERLQDPTHVHTSPEWCKLDAWLLAYDFPSSATICGLYKSRSETSGARSSHRLDDESLSALLNTCAKKKEEWEEFIAREPELAETWFQEYQIMSKEIGIQKNASRDSSRSASSRRSGPVGRRDNTSTIPEVPPVPALPEGAAPSGSAGDTPASSTSEGPVTLGPAHVLPNLTPRTDSGLSDENVGVIAGPMNPAQPGTASVPAE